MKIRMNGLDKWVLAVAICVGLSGCSTPTAPITPISNDCFPGWTDNGISGPPQIIQGWQTAHKQPFIGGLHLGDVAAKRAHAKRILKAPSNFTAPAAIDNGEYVSAIRDQGQLPECAAYSESEVLAASYWRSKDVQAVFDADAIYKAAKKLDGDMTDGTTLDAVLEAVRGASFTASGEIPTIIDGSLVSIDDLQYAVHKYGFVWVGMQITQNWMSPDASGRIKDGGAFIGGHAVVVVGYSATCRLVKILNSWGPDYGDRGFVYLSFEEFERELGYGITQIINWK